MTQPGIEPRSPGPLANTLPTRPMSREYMVLRNYFYLLIVAHLQVVYRFMGWLLSFYGISAFIGYLTPNQFLNKNQFYFKQFSLVLLHSLNIKNISISSYSAQSNSFNSNRSALRKYIFNVKNSSFSDNSVFYKYTV